MTLVCNVEIFVCIEGTALFADKLDCERFGVTCREKLSAALTTMAARSPADLSACVIDSTLALISVGIAAENEPLDLIGTRQLTAV